MRPYSKLLELAMLWNSEFFRFYRGNMAHVMYYKTPADSRAPLLKHITIFIAENKSSVKMLHTACSFRSGCAGKLLLTT